MIFPKLLLAYFYEVCPYIVPYYFRKQKNEDSKKYYERCGYIYNTEGKIEEQNMFVKRMCGVARLYAAYCVSRLPQSQADKPLPHGLGNIWKWLTSTMNLTPINDITASLICEILEVAGHSLYNNYKNNFHKLLLALQKKYFPMIKTVTLDGCGGPVARLELFLQKAISTRTIKPPEGLLSPNFL